MRHTFTAEGTLLQPESHIRLHLTAQALAEGLLPILAARPLLLALPLLLLQGAGRFPLPHLPVLQRPHLLLHHTLRGQSSTHGPDQFRVP